MGNPRPVAHVLVVLLVLAASVAAVSYAMLAFLADREGQALAFAAGGCCLTVWMGARLFIPPRT